MISFRDWRRWVSIPLPLAYAFLSCTYRKFLGQPRWKSQVALLLERSSVLDNKKLRTKIERKSRVRSPYGPKRFAILLENWKSIPRNISSFNNMQQHFYYRENMLLVINPLYLLRNILVYTQNNWKNTSFLSWFTHVLHTHRVAGSFPAGNRVIFCLSNVDPKF